MKMKMMMMMMIITGAFSNNTEKTISNIFRPVARNNPCDLCISLNYISEKTYLLEIGWMRKGGVNKGVKTTDNKRNEKLPF